MHHRIAARPSRRRFLQTARPRFAHLKTRKTIDGDTHEGWFASDFTFAELKTPRAVERLGAVRPLSNSDNGQCQIVSDDSALARQAVDGRDEAVEKVWRLA